MEFNSNLELLFRQLEKIIDFAKWMWKLERTETGIINSIFMIILVFVSILTCFSFKEDIYKFLLFLFIILFLGMSLIAVMKIEQEKMKINLYSELNKKYL